MSTLFHVYHRSNCAVHARLAFDALTVAEHPPTLPLLDAWVTSHNLAQGWLHYEVRAAPPSQGGPGRRDAPHDVETGPCVTARAMMHAFVGLGHVGALRILRSVGGAPAGRPAYNTWWTFQSPERAVAMIEAGDAAPHAYPLETLPYPLALALDYVLLAPSSPSGGGVLCLPSIVHNPFVWDDNARACLRVLVRDQSLWDRPSYPLHTPEHLPASDPARRFWSHLHALFGAAYMRAQAASKGDTFSAARAPAAPPSPSPSLLYVTAGLAMETARLGSHRPVEMSLPSHVAPYRQLGAFPSQPFYPPAEHASDFLVRVRDLLTEAPPGTDIEQAAFDYIASAFALQSPALMRRLLAEWIALKTVLPGLQADALLGREPNVAVVELDQAEKVDALIADLRRRREQLLRGVAPAPLSLPRAWIQTREEAEDLDEEDASSYVGSLLHSHRDALRESRGAPGAPAPLHLSPHEHATIYRLRDRLRHAPIDDSLASTLDHVYMASSRGLCAALQLDSALRTLAHAPDPSQRDIAEMDALRHLAQIEALREDLGAFFEGDDVPNPDHAFEDYGARHPHIHRAVELRSLVEALRREKPGSWGGSAHLPSYHVPVWSLQPSPPSSGTHPAPHLHDPLAAGRSTPARIYLTSPSYAGSRKGPPEAIFQTSVSPPSGAIPGISTDAAPTWTLRVHVGAVTVGSPRQILNLHIHRVWPRDGAQPDQWPHLPLAQIPWRNGATVYAFGLLMHGFCVAQGDWNAGIFPPDDGTL